MPAGALPKHCHIALHAQHGSGQFFCRSSRSLLHVVCNKRPMAAQSCRAAVSLPSARLPASALLNVCVCVYVYVCVCLPRFVLKCILCLQDGPKRTVQFFKSNCDCATPAEPKKNRVGHAILCAEDSGVRDHTVGSRRTMVHV